MSVEEFFPHRSSLPVGGEAHVGDESGIEGEKMTGQPVRPSGGGLDRLHEMREQNEGVVDAALFPIAQMRAVIMKVYLKMRGLFPR
jgi:hypothetical protein